LLATVLQSGLIATTLVHDTRRRTAGWLAAHLPPGTEVEVYQRANRLPGLRAVGLDPVRVHDFTRRGFRRRRPSVVLIGDNSNAAWSTAQNDFARWLRRVPDGYRAVEIRPGVENLPRAVFPSSLRVRIAPVYLVLERAESPGS
jgi:hypothetical protein